MKDYIKKSENICLYQTRNSADGIKMYTEIQFNIYIRIECI